MPQSTTAARKDPAMLTPRNSDTREETDDTLRSLADDARRIAGEIDRYYDTCQKLSPPVRGAGWPKPLADIGGHPFALRRWADILEGLSGQQTPPQPD